SDVRWDVSQLEEAMMRATADFGVATKRVEGQHGVWVDAPSGEEKLAALGVHLGRWVTSHGFAINVSTDLRFFDLIVPCGIVDKRPTSLERILGRAVHNGEVRPRLITRFGEVFGCAMIPVTRGELEEAASSRETPASGLLEAGIAKTTQQCTIPSRGSSSSICTTTCSSIASSRTAWCASSARTKLSVACIRASVRRPFPSEPRMLSKSATGSLPLFATMARLLWRGL